MSLAGFSFPSPAEIPSSVCAWGQLPSSAGLPLLFQQWLLARCGWHWWPKLRPLCQQCPGRPGGEPEPQCPSKNTCSALTPSLMTLFHGCFLLQGGSCTPLTLCCLEPVLKRGAPGKVWPLPGLKQQVPARPGSSREVRLLCGCLVSSTM